MSQKIVALNGVPKTQSLEAVRAFLKFCNHGQGVDELPPLCRLGAEMVLVMSNKGDVYYVTTPRNCSCPARCYHPEQPCEHMRRYFPAPKTEAQAMGESHAGPLELAQPPKDSIRPEGKWPGGFNGPVAETPGMA